jgi:hypothetical protein
VRPTGRARGFTPARALPLTALLACALACGAGRATETAAARAVRAQVRAATPAGAKAAGPLLSPARIFPPTERGEVSAETLESDGSRRFIAQGLRVIERPDGALEAAAEFLPPSKSASALELPRRWGGGFLFVVNAGGYAVLYRAPHWTGPLRPIGRLDGELERVVPGFDRLYVQRSRTTPFVAIDLEAGRELDLGSLVQSPSYGAMAFADEWLGAVEVPLRGVLATFDAGQSWHPLDLANAELSAVEAGILLETGDRRFVLGPTGALLPVRKADTPAPAASAARARAAGAKNQRVLGARPLETAVLHGIGEAGGTALVAAGGLLARVRLSDGAILERRADAYPGAAACEAVPLGDGAGFVCGDARGATNLYAFEQPFGLRAVRSFDGPRRVAPNGRGALVIAGGCAPERSAERSVCVLPRTGDAFEIAVPSEQTRVVALSDGRAALLDPPSAGGALAFVSASSPVPASRLALRPEKPEGEALRAVYRGGFWLDSFQEGPNGELSGWMASGSSFAGVRVKLDGSVALGTLQPGLDRALLSGQFGFVVNRGGAALETSDGGFEWSDAELPAEPDWRAQRTFGLESGCTALGCSVAGWLRVGWGMPEGAKLPIAELPDALRLPGPGGGRWSLECAPSGERSRLALPAVPEGDTSVTSPWNPLAEVAAPARARNEIGIDTGNEAELRLFRAYAWGSPDDGWGRAARWLVRVRDPYRVADAVWSTAPSPAPWPRAELTQDAFGRSPAGPAATWRVVTDPVKHAGVLAVGTKGVVELFALEEGHAIVRLKSSGAIGVVSGVAVAGSHLYVGTLVEARAYRVYRVDQGTLELVGEYPEAVSRAEPPILAAATRGDGLGLWLRGPNFYLFPIDTATGRIDAPLVTSARELAAMPIACAPNEDGYVVADALALEPSIRLQGGEGVESSGVGNGIEARLIVSPSRVCVDGLAAPLGSAVTSLSPLRSRRSGDEPARRMPPPRVKGATGAKTSDPGALPAPESPGARLVVNAPNGTRQGYRCRD